MSSNTSGRRRMCPRLGHEIGFDYCLLPGDEIPCPDVYDCWWESFDIAEYMETHYEQHVLQRLQKPRPDRLTTLIDIINQAEKRVRGKRDETAL